MDKSNYKSLQKVVVKHRGENNEYWMLILLLFKIGYRSPMEKEKGSTFWTTITSEEKYGASSLPDVEPFTILEPVEPFLSAPKIEPG